jgi:hypothetical protein
MNISTHHVMVCTREQVEQKAGGIKEFSSSKSFFFLYKLSLASLDLYALISFCLICCGYMEQHYVPA